MKSIQKWNKMLPVLLLGLGALLRLVYLGIMPAGMHQDEGFVFWNAYSLWTEGIDSAGSVWPIYLADWGDGHSALYSWMLLPLYALVGEENINLFICRLPQAVVGICTLWAVYLLLKQLFDEKIGRWGLFLLAICPWHIMMCRWGLDANLAPGFLIFGFYFFIRGLENNKWLLASAFLYGVGLYSYALTWPIIPVMLLLQIGYGIYLKKLSVNKWAVLSVLLLGILASPLMLFVLNNSFGSGEPICLGFMTIPVMGGYRADELAPSIAGMWGNVRRVITLLWRQNVGAVYDILLPHGLFYDIGRFFIIFGFVCLVVQMFKKLIKKEYAAEVFIFIQLIGAGITCAIVYVYLHQVNSLYIPLVLCQAYGVWMLIGWLAKRKAKIAQGVTLALAGAYLVCLVWFQRDYYGSYRELMRSYFPVGIQYATEYAMEQGTEIKVERGAQFSRILFYTKTNPKQYLDSVVYSAGTEPAHFSDGEHTFYINTDYVNIDKDKVYIIYFTEKEIFEKDFELKQFDEWYVAVPK